MSNLTSKQKEMGLILLSSIFLLTVVSYAYFTFYAPKKESWSVAETTLATDRQVLFALEQQLADQPETPIFSSLELQKKVPVKPLTDLVLLQIEKAEVVSDSLVQSISFSEGAFVIEAPPEGVETLQEILVTLSIETSTYATLETFIEELEQLDRILVVDSIGFSSNGEVTMAEQELEKLQLSLTFSAFYRPDLIELLDESPKVDTPQPADKVNPLPSNKKTDDGEAVINSTTTTALVVEAAESDNTADELGKVASIDESKPENQTYTVIPGDTLFSISMKHYGSRSGVDKIKLANSLQSNLIVANSTLIIPN